MAQKIHDRIGQLQNIEDLIGERGSRMLRRTEATLYGPITQLLAAQQRLEKKLDTIEAMTVVKTVQITTNSLILPSSSDIPSVSRSVHVPTTNDRWDCSGDCTCICHTRTLVKTPNFFEWFLGVLFLGYTGMPRISPRCNIITCAQRSSPSTTVLYIFPAWFLARAISITMRLSCFDGPQLTLRVPRRVVGHSAIFLYSSMGDIASLKEILSQRKGSPFDIDYDTGETALMVSSIRFWETSDHTNKVASRSS